MRRRRRRRRRRRFLQEVAHRTRRGCARRRGLVLASASCCSFGRRGHRAWWRGGACWLPLMPFAVFGYFHGGCWRARAQLRQYPPQTCSASIDALSLTPHVSAKKRRVRGLLCQDPGPGTRRGTSVGSLAARGRAGPPAVGRHLTSWKRRAGTLSRHDSARRSLIAEVALTLILVMGHRHRIGL